MAFDPALYNLISIKDLATAFNPDKGWLLAIQDPSGEVITKLTAEQLGILLNGNIQLPDGVLSGLDVTIGNATNPKTVSVSPGQYRINNGVYDLNAQYNANINAPGASDRTDAILADDTGDVYYQANYNGVAVDGTIVVTTFTVFASGADINPAPVIPAQYAVMNANNVGELTVTSQGDFQPEIFVALANINNASKYAIKNTSNGDFATAGYAAENDLGRKIQLLITSSGHDNYGLLPDRAYLLTNGAVLDIIAPQLLLNGVPIIDGNLLFANQVDAKLFGAKGDGIDGGIGDYNGDHDAINAALLAYKTVVISEGVYICKKPIILNDGNTLIINKGATLKLGDASNCTLLKTSAVDLPNDGSGNITYPGGVKTYLKNITIINEGVIDGNGWMQFRPDYAGYNNTLVVDTPIFKDGDNLPYYGAMIKIADVENFYFKAGILKNPRSYATCFGGLRNYIIDDAIGYRSYRVGNGDFLHFHGDCYNGVINNPYGTSSDDFIAITTKEAQNLTLRKGNVIGLTINNIKYFGMHPDAMPDNQIPMDYGIEAQHEGHRVLRVSYTEETIQGVVVNGVSSTHCFFGGWAVLSNLPFLATDNGRNGFGNGRIVDFTCRDVKHPYGLSGFIDVSDYLNVDVINILDCDYLSTQQGKGGLISFQENFSAFPDTSEHVQIKQLNVKNLSIYKGIVPDLGTGFISLDGFINNVNIDGISSRKDVSTDNYSLFGRSNTENLTIVNSDYSIFDAIWSPTEDTNFYELNSLNMSDFVCYSIFKKIQSNTLKFSDFNSYNPIQGDSFNIQGKGRFIFDFDGWKKIGGTRYEIAETSDSDGIIDLSSDDLIPIKPQITVYDPLGRTFPARYDYLNKVIDGLDPIADYIIVFN